MYERTLHSERVYDGRVVKLDVLEVELEDGTRAVREVIRHRGATAILPQLPDGRFVLVRQYRKAGDDDFIEVVAGVYDGDESPESCARRELAEETGYRAKELVFLGSIRPSPGYTEEKIELFFARLEGDRGMTDPDDDERIDLMYRSREEVLNMIRRHEIVDAKTLATWLLYEQWRQVEEEQA